MSLVLFYLKFLKGLLRFGSTKFEVLEVVLMCVLLVPQEQQCHSPPSLKCRGCPLPPWGFVGVSRWITGETAAEYYQRDDTCQGKATDGFRAQSRQGELISVHLGQSMHREGSCVPMVAQAGALCILCSLWLFFRWVLWYLSWGNEAPWYKTPALLKAFV